MAGRSDNRTADSPLQRGNGRRDHPHLLRRDALAELATVAGDSLVQGTSMERAAQIFAAVNFIVIGLSHILQPRAWVDFFVMLRAKGNAGVFANAMLSLFVGSIIVAFHTVWTGLPIVLTVVGWGQVVKGLLNLTMPSIGARTLARVSVERSSEFIAAGAVLLAVGLLQVYLIARG